MTEDLAACFSDQHVILNTDSEVTFKVDARFYGNNHAARERFVAY